MMYEIKTRLLQERRELIKNGCELSEEGCPFHEFQDTRHNLPIIRIGIDVLVYRMLNYRTRTAQLKYIYDNEKPKDFFAVGQENEEAQRVQHGILISYAKKGRAESVVPIFDALRKEEQREPLIVTTGGVVVNGNRRLAAMRELFAEDSSRFSNFSHVNCAVLPGNATSEDIKEIEVRLQMRSETKLPYEWVNESLAIQELLNNGKSFNDIARLMNKKRQEVELADQALIEADIYLREWADSPGKYQLVEDGQQFFGDLAKGLVGKQSDSLEISRRFAWALFKAKNLTGRVYAYKFSFSNRTDEVIESLVDRLGIDMTSQRENNDEEGADVLDIDIGDEDEEEVTSLAPLIDFFDDASRREQATDELVAICDNMIEMNRQGEIGGRALAAVQSANNKLQEVDLSKAEASTYDAIGHQLSSVIERAEKLKKGLSLYKSS